MADQTQANDVGGTQQAPMPSAEQQTSEQSVAQPAAPQEVSGTTETESTLPSDASERTRQNFEKLREDLRKANDRNALLEQTYVSKPQPVVQTPIYDPSTGYVDVGQLEIMRTQAADAQRKADQVVAKYERDRQLQQEQEAYSAHPELNPDNPSQDKELFKLTRAIIMDSSLNPQDYGGKELSAKQAADMAKKQQAKLINKVRQDAATEAVEQLSPKEQATLEATGRSDRRVDTRDHSELIERTRRGDTDAIMQRFNNIG